MSAPKKDKRTKDQLLLLLDNALVQEEKLSDQIADLQAELDELRKRNANPHAGQVEEALPSTKIPFRLDFYRTTHDGPLKGIIEHLPSRQKRTFEGDGRSVLQAFIGQFIQEITTENNANPNAPGEEAPADPALPVAMRKNMPAVPCNKLAQRLTQDFYRQFPEIETTEAGLSN